MRLPPMAAEGTDATIRARTAYSMTEPAFLQARLAEYFGGRLHPHGGENLLIGATPHAGDIVLQSNDYLRMGQHPDVVAARIDAAALDAGQAVMSGVFQGAGSPQARLEQALADFTHAGAALLCQSGWNANVGLVQALVAPDSPVYIDQFGHMSLWEGITSAGARPVVFRHNRVEHLESLVRRNGPGLILVDAVYSTSGSIAPLASLARLATQHGCLLVVDESHSLGTHGPGGSGLVAELGLLDRVHLRTASLAKACAGRGGVIVGSERLVEFLRFRARPAIFSSGLLAGEMHVFEAVLDTLAAADAARQRLRRLAACLRTRLIDLGFDVGISGAQILGLVAGTEARTVRLRDALERHGIFGSVFAAPATPKNRSLLRLSLHAELSTEDLDRIVRAARAVRGEVDLAQWPGSRRLRTVNGAAGATNGLLSRVRARFDRQFPVLASVDRASTAVREGAVGE